MNNEEYIYELCEKWNRIRIADRILNKDKTQAAIRTAVLLENANSRSINKDEQMFNEGDGI